MAEEKKSRAVAEHQLLGADGAVVENMEDAHGIRYTDIASGLTTDQMIDDANMQRMLACFGAKTLATNEASQSRQREGTSADQIAAINERFDWMRSQKSWVDTSREVGARYDLPTMATAAVEVAIAAGKLKSTDEAKGKAYDKFLALLSQEGNAGKAALASIRAVDGVEAAYKRLAGKTAKTADDLAAMLDAE